MRVDQARALLRYKALATQVATKLDDMAQAWLGQTVHILGSGPSLHAETVERFEGRHVLYLNNTLTLHERVRPSQSYCVISDHLRMYELRNEAISQHVEVIASTDKVLNAQVNPHSFDSPVTFVMPKLTSNPAKQGLQVAVCRSNGFSFDLREGVFLGRSVLFVALQVAAHLGASRIVLSGVDMSNNQGLYFDPRIKSNWTGFSYENDALPHLTALLPLLRFHSIRLERERNLGRLALLPHVEAW